MAFVGMGCGIMNQKIIHLVKRKGEHLAYCCNGKLTKKFESFCLDEYSFLNCKHYEQCKKCLETLRWKKV